LPVVIAFTDELDVVLVGAAAAEPTAPTPSTRENNTAISPKLIALLVLRLAPPVCRDIMPRSPF